MPDNDTGRSDPVFSGFISGLICFIFFPVPFFVSLSLLVLLKQYSGLAIHFSEMVCFKCLVELERPW